MRTRLILPLVAGLGLSAGCGLLPTGGPGPDEYCYNPPPPAWLYPDWIWDTSLPAAHSAPEKTGYKLDFITVSPASDGPARVARTTRDGTERWSRPLPEGHRAGRAFESKTGIYLVTWSPATSGGTVQFIDAETGEARWSKQLQALGPQSHSEYRNEIQAEVVDGHLIVRGDEAHGQYVEAYAESGEQRSHRLHTGLMTLGTAGADAGTPPRVLIAGALVHESDTGKPWLIELPDGRLIGLDCKAPAFWKAGQRVTIEADLTGPNTSANCTLR